VVDLSGRDEEFFSGVITSVVAPDSSFCPNKLRRIGTERSASRRPTLWCVAGGPRFVGSDAFVGERRNNLMFRGAIGVRF